MLFEKPEPRPEPLLVNCRDAARILAISERTLYTLTKTGAIQPVRIGRRSVRYARADLEAWIEHQKKAS